MKGWRGEKGKKLKALQGIVPDINALDDEYRRLSDDELRGKTAQYKRMKQELAELRSEWGVLSRTQAILEGEAKKVAGSG